MYFLLFNYVYELVYGFVHMNAGTQWRRKLSDPPGAGITGVPLSCLKWVLGLKLRPSTRVMQARNRCVISLADHTRMLTALLLHRRTTAAVYACAHVSAGTQES